MGTQFVVAKPHARALIVAVATVAAPADGLRPARRSSIRRGPALVVDRYAGRGRRSTRCARWLAFHVAEALPGAVARGRSRPPVELEPAAVVRSDRDADIPAPFEDRREPADAPRRRCASALVVCFGALAVGFWILQVVQHAKYESWADNNYLRTIPLRAPRGVLFDRNGRVLVENRDSFTIVLAARADRATSNETHRAAGRRRRLDEARVRETMQRRRGASRSSGRFPSSSTRRWRRSSAVQARQLELPEVVVQQVPTRAYPDDGLAAHLFGYVGEIQDDQLDRPRVRAACSPARSSADGPRARPTTRS